jgi:nucleotide-binding universal stress UspA family protein
LASALPPQTTAREVKTMIITIKKIIVPMDFSNISVPAIGYAISLAKIHGAEVSVLHTLPSRAMKEHFSGPYAADGLAAPGAAPIGVTASPNIENLFERKKQVLHNFLEQKIAPELLGAVKINMLVRIGKVAEEIVAAAKEEQCDLIVMTSHRGRLGRLLHGSFTERVVRQAPCPVLSIQPWAQIRTEENKRVPVSTIEKWAA